MTTIPQRLREIARSVHEMEYGQPGALADSLRAIAAELEKPIDMILHCPACLEQHIDEPQTHQPEGVDVALVWTNPPHRSHKCQHCGFQWRPADVATNGVAAIKTKGKDDMVLVEVPAERLHKMRQTRATTWVSFADAAPPVDVTVHGLDPTATVPRKVLVTNNLHARDATGRMSHVWLAMPHEGREGWVAFDEGDCKIRNLTHWRDPFAGDAL